MRPLLWRPGTVLFGLVAGFVADDDDAGDLVAVESEVVGEDQRVGEPSLVILAVDRSGDNPAPVVLLYVCEVGSDDVIAHALLIGPALDGGGTPELPLDVVQQAVVGERGDHASLSKALAAAKKSLMGL